jgi:hypothetical protein
MTAQLGENLDAHAVAERDLCTIATPAGQRDAVTARIAESGTLRSCDFAHG